MSTSETRTYSFEIVLSTTEGELPSDSEVKHMVEDQMNGELDETTGLFCIAVRLKGATDGA
jgi:hypothetical protein